MKNFTTTMRKKKKKNHEVSKYSTIRKTKTDITL